MGNRDNFSQKTIDTLSERVGGKCSNPYCRQETQGPHSDPKKRVSIGEAAHITAAAEGGPRYDPTLTSEQRSSIENGIWLCRRCAKMIDSDEKRYPAELLRKWKSVSEAEQLRIISQRQDLLNGNMNNETEKKEALRQLKQCLDDLQYTLKFAYEYWDYNFNNSFSGIRLESELEEHWFIYEDDLKLIDTYRDKCANLYNLLGKNSLDYGEKICMEVEKYCNELRFSFQHDRIGFYDNYWRCFFEMISGNYVDLVKRKSTIDELLYQLYSL